MAARASQAGPGGISLFPFMSILACVIGILTFMISVAAALKSQDTGGRTKQQLERAQSYQKMDAAARITQEELQSLQKAHAAADAGTKRLEELQDRLAVLRQQMEDPEAKNPAAASRNLQKQLEDLLTRLAQFSKERPALEAKIALLKAELEKRKLDVSAKPLPVVVQPGGTGSAAGRAKPFFVECNGDGLVIHIDDKQSRVTTTAIGADADYNRFLSTVKKIPDALLIFLLREDGHSAWTRGAGLAKSRFDIKTGKLPVPGKGEIDLTRFTR